jgi:hypothetical protein
MNRSKTALTTAADLQRRVEMNVGAVAMMKSSANQKCSSLNLRRRMTSRMTNNTSENGRGIRKLRRKIRTYSGDCGIGDTAR